MSFVVIDAYLRLLLYSSRICW